MQNKEDHTKFIQKITALQHGAVKKYFYKAFKNEHTAEDLAQEWCFRMLSKFDNYQKSTELEFRKFFFTVARNMKCDEIKRQNKIVVSGEYDDVQSSIEEVEQRIEDIIGNCLSSEKEKQVFVKMFLTPGNNQEKVAVELGISQSQVSNIVNQIIAIVEEYLEEGS